MVQRVYRPYDPDRPLSMPGDLREWLPPDHLVYLLSDIVDTLDLSPIVSVYEQGDGRGYPPYHPVMMTRLLLYAYCQGVVSSRVIARKTYEDIAFRILTVDQHPDFRTVSDFRERHLPALRDLFEQVVHLAQRLALVRLEHVAQDGSKVLANASKHKAMSYGRMPLAEERLGREIEAILEAARAADAAEDPLYGPTRSGDELPEDLAAEVAFRQRRLENIHTAKAALEQEARARAEAIRAADAAEREAREREGRPKKPGRPPNPSDTPAPDAQRNFTDPDSRIMKNSDKAYVQAYNAQAAVDSLAQIIVGCDLTNQAADAPHLLPMVEQVKAVTGRLPDQWSSDAGYFSEDNVDQLEGQRIDVYIPPDRQTHQPGEEASDPLTPTQPVESPGSTPPTVESSGSDESVPGTSPDPPGSQAEAGAQARMRAKLATPEGKATYSRRKETAEPVFGQIKQGRGLRRFLLRGLTKVKAEWTLWCLTHNLLKIARALVAKPALREQLKAA